MKADFESLYYELLADVKRTWDSELPEIECVQNCFNVAISYWGKVKRIFLAKSDYDDDEEIIFFREVKPLFTAYMELYLILYKGLLFQPEEMEKMISYWKAQAEKYTRYFEVNADFIDYYESCSMEYDEQYFLMRNNKQKVSKPGKLYDDADCRSSHDYLVRGLLANSMYYDYVIQRLRKLNSGDVSAAKSIGT